MTEDNLFALAVAIGRDTSYKSGQGIVHAVELTKEELFCNDPAKADLYKALAAEMNGISVDEVTKEQRQVGKQLHLLCGYGGGPGVFLKSSGLKGLDLEQAAAYVESYRENHGEIVRGWRACNDGLSFIAAGQEYAIDDAPDQNPPTANPAPRAYGRPSESTLE